MQNCYSSALSKGKVPRELLANQDERLTAKHIQTLSFLQDLARENKELRARIEDLENHSPDCLAVQEAAIQAQAQLKILTEKYHKREDELTQELTEKHRLELMQKVEEKLRLEKQWGEEKQKLKGEIDGLKKIISNLQGQLRGSKETVDTLQDLHEKIARLENELSAEQADKEKVVAENGNQIREIERLNDIKERNVELISEVKEVNQKNKELLYRISKLEREISEAAKSDNEEIMTSLRNRLSKIHKEKSAWETREKELLQQIEDLQEENAKLRRALSDSERMRGETNQRLEAVLEELNQLRRNTLSERDRQTFKDYIQVKRELAQVREENEELKIRLKFGGERKSSSVLPSLKADGGGDRRKKERSKSTRHVDAVHRPSKY